jgi:hypothetical protein
MNFELLSEHIEYINDLLLESSPVPMTDLDKMRIIQLFIENEELQNIAHPLILKDTFKKVYDVTEKEWKELVLKTKKSIEDSNDDETQSLFYDPNKKIIDTKLFPPLVKKIKKDLGFDFKVKPKNTITGPVNSSSPELEDTFIKLSKEFADNTQIKQLDSMKPDSLDTSKILAKKNVIDSSTLSTVYEEVIFIQSHAYALSLFTLLERITNICQTILQSSYNTGLPVTSKGPYKPFDVKGNTDWKTINHLRKEFNEFFKIYVNNSRTSDNIIKQRIVDKFVLYFKKHVFSIFTIKHSNEKLYINQKKLFKINSINLIRSLEKKIESCKKKGLNLDADLFIKYLRQFSVMIFFISQVERIALPIINKFFTSISSPITSKKIDFKTMQEFIDYRDPTKSKIYHFARMELPKAKALDDLYNIFSLPNKKFQNRFVSLYEKFDDADSSGTFDFGDEKQDNSEEMEKLHININMGTLNYQTEINKIIKNANEQQRSITEKEFNIIKLLKAEIEKTSLKIAGSEEKYGEYLDWVQVSGGPKYLEDKRISDKMIQILKGRAQYNRDGRLKREYNPLSGPSQVSKKQPDPYERISDIQLPPGTVHNVKTGNLLDKIMKNINN